MSSGATPGADEVQRYRYFMLRATEGHGAGEIAGLIELLGSGEKQAFGSAQEMVRLLTAWVRAGPDAARRP